MFLAPERMNHFQVAFKSQSYEINDRSKQTAVRSSVYLTGAFDLLCTTVITHIAVCSGVGDEHGAKKIANRSC